MKRLSWKYSFLLGVSMLAGASLSAYVVSIRPEGNMPIWDQSQYPVEVRMWEGFRDGLDHVVRWEPTTIGHCRGDKTLDQSFLNSAQSG